MAPCRSRLVVSALAPKCPYGTHRVGLKVTPEPDDHANSAPTRPRQATRSTRPDYVRERALDTKRILIWSSSGAPNARTE